MPEASTARLHRARTRPPRRLVAITLAATGLLSAGCDTLASAQQGLGHAPLVNDLAARLTSAEQGSYTAHYQLAGGRSAVVARQAKPSRTAYRYPGGVMVLTAASSTECLTSTKPAHCRRTGAQPADNAPIFDRPDSHGLIATGVVIKLLTATALDPHAVVTQRDTTMAGENATCVTADQVRAAPASSYSACVTTSGVLASASMTIDGQRVELTLTAFSPTVAPNLFNLPAGAILDDQRPGH